MANHFAYDECKVRLRKLWVESRCLRQTAKALDLRVFSRGVRGRQIVACLQCANLPRATEAFGQQMDHCCVDVVDALAEFEKLRLWGLNICHVGPLSSAR